MKRRYDLVVIGGGTAGLVSAAGAAALGAKVALAERDKLGGDCLYRGCVPTKTLVKSARVARLIGRSEEYGIKSPGFEVDFPAVMDRMDRAIRTAGEHNDPARTAYTSCLSQPPVHAIAALRIWEAARSGSEGEISFARAFLKGIYPGLLSWHRYLLTYRDSEESGLVTIYHPWGSGTDNPPALGRAPPNAGGRGRGTLPSLRSPARRLSLPEAHKRRI